jgi:predicted RNase H-like HicB family nuclease
MAEQTFDITWRDGAYYVSVPNYKGGKVYESEYVDRLLAVLRETREDLEMYGLDDFGDTTEEAIDRIDAVLIAPRHT